MRSTSLRDYISDKLNLEKTEGRYVPSAAPLLCVSFNKDMGLTCHEDVVASGLNSKAVGQEARLPMT